MSIKIIKAGILDTIQDSGRRGYRYLGINPSGVMDGFSAQLCNALLGKEPDAAVIEMHFPASIFLFQKASVACLSGADFSATINNYPVPLLQPFLVSANSLLKFNGLTRGAHCYLSLLHDLQIEGWLQSASTNLKAGAGGWKGRRLEKDDSISFREDINLPFMPAGEAVRILHWKASAPKSDNELSCIIGKEWNWLTPESQFNFLHNAFAISNLSDRMGYRLFSDELRVEKSEELVSSGVDFGTVQLLPNGQLIILMADHQTTGGYARLAHISTTSLHSVAQLKSADEIYFRFIDVAQAENELVQQKKYLEQLRGACKIKIENLSHAST